MANGITIPCFHMDGTEENWRQASKHSSTTSLHQGRSVVEIEGDDVMVKHDDDDDDDDHDDDDLDVDDDGDLDVDDDGDNGDGTRK